ncbi:Protein JTB [Armadillidium nasatum]|uniref:Protein JTB n=1 Tax=Armadillidium nasatum TaxID=96803 RepID=A0A5N5SWH2_9CRUS|nr:Protein JTB [Armadillidium nasatum]
MIEFCTKRRMVIAVAFLIGLSVVVVIIENEWTPDDVHHHSHDSSSDNLTKAENCWMVETYDILEECQPCTDLEKESKSIEVCKSAIHRQKIKCSKTGEVYRKCDRVVWLEERHFIFFESLMLALGLVSGAFTFYRQRVLDRRVLQRIQRQVAAGV